MNKSLIVVAKKTKEVLLDQNGCWNSFTAYPSKKLQHGMNKSLIVVAKKTKEVLHKMAAGLCTVYRLKETILAHAHSIISIKPACGDEATAIHIKKV